MWNIIIVFLASFIIVGSIAYIVYTFNDQEVEDDSETGEEHFGIPTRTQTLVANEKNCDTNEDEEEDDEEDEDEDEVISMEDVLKMRNDKGETVEQKITQKASGMGFREGSPGPSEQSSGSASKPENQLNTKNGIVWAKSTDSSADKIGPSHLMGAMDSPTSGGILPGLDREAGSYSPV